MKKKALELMKFFALCAIIFVLVVEAGALIMRVGVALGYKPEMIWEELESSELYQRAFPDRIPKKDPSEIISDDHPNRIDSDGVVNPDELGEVFVYIEEHFPDRWDAVEVDPAIADDPVSDGYVDFLTGVVYRLPSIERFDATADGLRREIRHIRQSQRIQAVNGRPFYF